MEDILRSVDIKNTNIDLGIGKFGIDQEKIRKRLPEIRKIIFDEKVTIYFVPSAKLKQLVEKGGHHLLKDMPDAFKAMILEGNGVLIQKLMVYNWLRGELDKKNSFILSNGELKVTNDNYTLVDSEKEKNNDRNK